MKPAWQENAPEFIKPGNMATYAPPRDWGKACAMQNLRTGVRLTDAQKERFPDLARVEAGLLEAKERKMTDKIKYIIVLQEKHSDGERVMMQTFDMPGRKEIVKQAVQKKFSVLEVFTEDERDQAFKLARQGVKS